MPAPPDKLQGETIPLGPKFVDFTVLEPIGVTAHIVPWNFPLGMAMRGMAPALAAGCTVVLKPSEQSPLSALKMAELVAEAGFPKGVINIVPGLGSEAGEALVRHPLVRGVTFTGSVATGRKILAAAAHGIKPSVLELGGKNPMIVFADADIGRAVDDALAGSFENCGQVCSSSSRYLLHPKIRDEFIDRLGDKAAKLSIGPGIDNHDLGPMVSAAQYAKVLGYLERGRSEGARARFGGNRPGHLQRGYFIEPTVLDQVNPASTVAREEIFGPVGIAVDIADEADAIESPTVLAMAFARASIRRISRARCASPVSLRPARSGSMAGGWVGSRRPPAASRTVASAANARLAGLRNYLQVKNIAVRL